MYARVLRCLPAHSTCRKDRVKYIKLLLDEIYCHGDRSWHPNLSLYADKHPPLAGPCNSPALPHIACLFCILILFRNVF